MKLRRVLLGNIRSFLDPAELLVDGDVSIVIGPNGGGKTNLLDATTTVLRRHFLTSWVPRRAGTPEHPDRYQMSANDALDVATMRPHHRGEGIPQRLEIELEVSEPDISNIRRMQEDANKLADIADVKYIGAPVRQAKDWNATGILPGQRFAYTIEDNALKEPAAPEARVFRDYLRLYEAHGRLRDWLKMEPLSTPMISLPANRGASGFQSSLSLAGCGRGKIMLFLGMALC